MLDPYACRSMHTKMAPLQIKKSVTDFAKTADQPAPEKVNADEGVYYLVNPEGEFERAFGHDIDSLAIALAVCTDC